ncbi:MAG: hypothetical protein Q9160_001063 [Pyrenula sp. 1 TL-2023]
MPERLAPIAPPASEKPVNRNDKDENPIDYTNVIHVAGFDGLRRREAKKYNIAQEADRAHPKWAMLNTPTAFDKQANHRNGVGDIQEDDARSD